MVVRKLTTLLGFNVKDTQKAKGYEKTIAGIWKVSKWAALGLGVLGGVALKSASDMEQQQLAFETMLQSAEKATALLNDIEKFAATTPFEQTELIGFSKQLLAFGTAAEDIIPTMTTLGDIAAGVGTQSLPTLVRAYGKIQTKGRATMEELNMIMEAGVPILTGLAEELGTNETAIIKMVSQGKISFNEFQRAMERVRKVKFMDLMNKQSKTLGGLLSNVADAFGIIGRRIGQAVLPMAKDLVKEFLEFLDINGEVIISGLGAFFNGVITVIGYVVVIIQELIKAFGGMENIVKVVMTIFKVFAAIMRFVLGIVIGVIKIFWDFRGLLVALLGPILAVIAVMKIWAAVQTILNIIMSLNPLGLIIIGIFLLILAIGLLVKAWDKIKAALLKLWEQFKAFIRRIAFWAKEFVRIITWPHRFVIRMLISAWMKFFEFLMAGWDSISAGISSAIEWMSAKIEAFMTWITEAGETIGKFFDKFRFGGGGVGGNQLALAGAGGGGNAGGITQKSSTLNVNSNVSVGVPEGTPEAQRNMVKDAGKQAVQEEWNRILRGASTNNPEAD